MANADKVKIIVDNALRKVGEYSDRASDKAGGLAERAAEKAGELSETAREKAPDFLDRAAELAERATEAAAAGVDKLTGGRYHDQIHSAHDKVDETLHRVRSAPSADHGPDVEPDADLSAGPATAHTAPGPVTTPVTPTSTPTATVPTPAAEAPAAPEAETPLRFATTSEGTTTVEPLDPASDTTATAGPSATSPNPNAAEDTTDHHRPGPL